MRRIRLHRRQRGGIGDLAGLFVLLVLFPAMFTALAPRTTVELQRDASGVSATVSSHTLFFIPYRRQHETRVTRVELEFDRGERVGYNTQLSAAANRPSNRGRTEDSAVIHFAGDGEGASAMIEIGRMEAVLAEAQRFVDDPDSTSLTLSFMAHRVIGLYVGLPLSLLVLLALPLFGLALTRRVLGRPYWPFA